MTFADFRKKPKLPGKHAGVLSDALAALREVLASAAESPDGSDTGPSGTPTPTAAPDGSGAPTARSVPVLRYRR